MIRYIIQPGDSLHDIAIRFKVSINSIMVINQISNPYDIYPGKLIHIPIGRYFYFDEIRKNYPIDQLHQCQLSIHKKRGVNTPPFYAKMVLSGLLIVLSSPRMIYKRGDTIILNLFKLNLSSQPIKLTYNTGQRYDFKIIYPTGQTLWMWSKNKSFIQALGSVNFDIGQSVLYTEAFIIPDNLPPGAYQVLGWNTAQEIRSYKLHIPIYITN